MNILQLAHSNDTHWRREWQPIPFPCLENSMHRGAWWAGCRAQSGEESDMTE